MGHRVFAIRYGYREATRAETFYGLDPHDGPMPMDYFMWAVVGDGPPVVVDTGFTLETAVRRNRDLTRDPIELLSSLGIEADRVLDVILTHLHYDHCGNMSAFPEARFWVQDTELRFWTGRHAGRGEMGKIVEPDDIAELVRLNFDRRVRFVDGVGTVAPGISVHRVGGHAPGLQVVRVETEQGPIVLASDASHYYENLERDRPFAIVHSLPEMYAAFDRLHELAASPGDIVPGHDPLVLERYPAPPELSGSVVEICAGREGTVSMAPEGGSDPPEEHVRKQP
ncbi:MAG: N-acyl homoserine lactonase family protein [Actinomycetota bacterium]